MPPKHLNLVENSEEKKEKEILPIAFRIMASGDGQNLKKLNIEALNLIASAFGATAAERRNWTDEDWENYIAESPNIAGVNDAGDFVAMAGAKEEIPGTWRIHSVYVDRGYRFGGEDKKSRGELLLGDLIQLVAEKGAQEIKLTVNTKQNTAVDLYKRLGFSILWTEKDSPSADTNFYEKHHMELDLSRVARSGLALKAA